MATKLPAPDADFLERGKITPVTSSNVKWLQYVGDTLTVGYHHGGKYRCTGVDPERALQIRRADSVGAALKDLERTHGKFTKCV